MYLPALCFADATPRSFFFVIEVALFVSINDGRDGMTFHGVDQLVARMPGDLFCVNFVGPICFSSQPLTSRRKSSRGIR